MSRSSTAERLAKVRLSDFSPLKSNPLDFYPGLYALFDAEGQCLYIGQSKDVPARLKRHRRERPWFKDVDESKTVTFQLSGAEDRLHLEALLQLYHRPRHCRAIKIGIRNDGKIYEMQFLRSAR
jgi:predicted GIY-YIG superfamily endonuclease